MAAVDNIISDILVRARTQGLKVVGFGHSLRNLQGAQRANQDQMGKGKAAVQKYQGQMDHLGMSWKNQAENSKMFVRNLNTVRKSLHDTSRVGASTTGSIGSLTQGTRELGNTNMGTLSSFQKMRVMIHSTRSGLMSLTRTYANTMKNLQWVGRQLMVGLSLPLYAVGAAALRTFTTIEEEFTRLRKVLDTGQQEELGIGIAQGFDAVAGTIKGTYDIAAGTGYETEVQLGNIRDSVNELSIAYGTNQSIVTAVTADWAAMGYTAQNLVPAVDEVMRIAALGDVDVSVATKGLSNLINVFGKDIDTVQGKIEHAGDIVNQFNAIENATVLQMKELIEAFPQAGEVARQFGLTAAGTAASLVAMKAAGFDATEGAHAIKFGLQRIINPTTKAREAAEDIRDTFGEVGQTFLNVMDGAVRGQDALDQFAQAYMTLLGDSNLTAQRFLSDLVGKRQAARLGSLFDQMNAGLLEYNTLLESNQTISADNATNQWLKAMIASGEKGRKTLEEMNSELDESSRLELELKLEDPALQIQRLKVQLQALGHDFIAAVWPAIQKVIAKLTDLINWFKDLSGGMKNLIAISASLVAALGPLLFVFSQLGLALAEVSHMIVRFLPKMGFFNQGQAEAAIRGGELQENLISVGNAYVRNDTLLGRLITGYRKWRNESKEAGTALRNLAGAHHQAGRAMARQAGFEASMRARPSPNQFPTAIAVAQGRKHGQQAAEAFSAGYMSSTGRLKRTFKDTFKSLISLAVSPIRGAMKLIFAPAMPALRKFGKGIKETFGMFRIHLSDVNDGVHGLGNKFRNLGTVISRTWRDRAGKGFFSGIWEKMKSLPQLLMSGFTGVVAMIGTIAAGLSTIVAGAAFLAVGFWIFLPAIAGVVALISTMHRHWDDVYAAMKPGLDSLKQSWDNIRTSLDRIVAKILDYVGVEKQIGEGIWGTLGRAVGDALEGIGSGLEAMVDSLEAADGLWERMGGTIQYTVMAVKSAIEGDWGEAWHNLMGAFMWGFIVPAVEAIEWLIEQLLIGLGKALQSIAGVFQEMQNEGGDSFLHAWDPREVVNGGLKWLAGGAMSELGEGFGAEMADGVNLGLNENVRGFAEERFPVLAGSANRFAQGLEEYMGPAAEEAGEEAGGDFDEAAAEEIAEAEASQDAAREAANKWRSALKSALDELVNKMKKDAMEALEASHEARLAIFDERIEAIDELEKKEQELYDTEEYLNRKRKARDEFGLEIENYKRSRALALYEGRIDDARILDSEMLVSARDHKTSMARLEDDRARDLLSKERDEQRARINMRKEALAEILAAEKENFQERLDLLTRYTPRNIAQVQALIDGVGTLLNEYGVQQWSSAYTNAVDTWSQATQLARSDLEDQAYWSGEGAGESFAAGVEGSAPGGGDSGGETGAEAFEAEHGYEEKNKAAFGRAFKYSAEGQTTQYNRMLQDFATRGISDQWRAFQRELRRFFGGAGVSASGNSKSTVGTGNKIIYNTGFHTGGMVNGLLPRDVSATLQSGEYVIQRDAAKALGSGALSRLNEAHTYHSGGPVGHRHPDNFQASPDSWSPFMGGSENMGFGAILGDMIGNFMGGGGGTIGGQTYDDFSSMFQAVFAGWSGQIFAGIQAGLAISGLASLMMEQFAAMGLIVSSTTDHNKYVSGTNRISDHYGGNAVDLAAPMTEAGIALMRQVFEYAVANAAGLNLKQAIFQHDIWSGGTLTRGGYGPGDHMNHVHLAVTKALAAFAGGGGGGVGAVGGGPLKDKVKNYAARAYGWTGGEWGNLHELIQRESSWNPAAQNPHSTAWGLFQFLNMHWGPGRYLPAGRGSSVDQQIQGGLRYIKDRYGVPSRAIAHHNRMNWYHEGGPAMMKTGGIVPMDNYPAMLHKGEAVLPSQLTAALSAVSGKRYMTPAGMSMLGVSAGDGGGGGTSAFGGGDTYIHVDTFIGEEQWFTEMKKQYDMKTGGAKRRKHGTINRSVSSRMDNTVRYG